MNGSKFSLLQPVVQAGFAGFSVLLLGIVCWQVNNADACMKSMMHTQVKTNQVIERNTAAINELSRVVHNKLN